MTTIVTDMISPIDEYLRIEIPIIPDARISPGYSGQKNSIICRNQ